MLSKYNSLRLGCSVAVSGFISLMAGGQGLYIWNVQQQPTSMSCAELVAGAVTRDAHPEMSKWLRLTGCEIDTESGFFIDSRERTMAFVARVPKQPPRAPVKIVMSTEDPALVELARRVLGGEGDDPIVAREIDGLARFGIDLRRRDLRDLADHINSLSGEFIYLSEERRADFGWSVFFFCLGILMLSVYPWLWLRRRRRRKGFERLKASFEERER